MKNLSLIFVILLAFVSCKSKTNNSDLMATIDQTLNFAEEQGLMMAQSLADQPDRLPQTLDENGNLVTSNSAWWCSGFFPGELWYLYENSQNEELKKWAEEYTSRVEKEQYTTNNHDVGFMIFCSYGNGYRITQNEDYLNVIHNAANSLSTRFNPVIGCIRSWDRSKWNEQWQYAVIIDNMMNLELLTWASKKFEDSKLMDIAKTHANKTIENHYRDDMSSFHVVSYDTLTGNVEVKHTSQGYSHSSAWARGQAWGLYGYTMMFRETGDSVYLDQAVKIANFIINHPNLPEDKIPYWDFDAPDIPNAKRDVSAGAIICSALIELSQYADQTNSSNFLNVAEQQLKTLCSPAYLANLGENGNFLLKHGVGNIPNNSEIDVPLTYADYYFVEAMLRYKALFANK